MRFAKPALKGAVTLAIFGVVVLIPLKIVPMVQQWLEDRQAAGTKHAVLVHDEKLAELAHDQPDTLLVDNDVQKTLGIALAEVQSAVPPEPLKLDGTLYPLSNSTVHVHARFSGDVVEIGKIDGPLGLRPIEPGDFVHKGQLLAVVWSKELGEKKNELVESLARLRTDDERLKSLENGEKNGAITPAQVREQRRLVEADTVAVNTAERTLRTWQVPESEIEAVRAEADKIRERNVRRNARIDENWARLELRAFMDGTIVEKNANLGDFVANDLELFKITDLSRMDVIAHAYEEDVPALERLPFEHRDWTIYVKADPHEEPLKGSFERILPIIDPTQHTALVRGWVENSRGRLRVGQFITAWINLPTPADEVSLPVSALVDQDGQMFVFVHSSSDHRRFTRRKVFVRRRRGDTVSLSCQSRAHSAGSACEVEPLKVGDRVVTAGGLQLGAELTNLQSQATEAAPGGPKSVIDAVQK